MKEKTKNILKVILRVVTEIIRHFTTCKKKEAPEVPESTESKVE